MNYKLVNIIVNYKVKVNIYYSMLVKVVEVIKAIIFK